MFVMFDQAVLYNPLYMCNGLLPVCFCEGMQLVLVVCFAHQPVTRQNICLLMQRRAGAKGFGLFACEDLQENQFIIEYIGEVGAHGHQFHKVQACICVLHCCSAEKACREHSNCTS